MPHVYNSSQCDSTVIHSIQCNSTVFVFHLCSDKWHAFNIAFGSLFAWCCITCFTCSRMGDTTRGAWRTWTVSCDIDVVGRGSHSTEKGNILFCFFLKKAKKIFFSSANCVRTNVHVVRIKIVFQSPQIGCLSDALSDMERLLPPPRPSSALLTDFLNAEYDEHTGLMRNIRSEAHTPTSTPQSPQSVCNDLDDDLPDNAMLDKIIASPMVIPERKPRSRSIQHNNPLMSASASAAASAAGANDAGVGSKRGSLTYRSLERLNRGPNRVSVYGEQAQIQIPHPFRGAQSSQMICTGCGYKSVVRYDKFDSISLALPEIKNPGLSLGHLLSDYVASENLSDVTCESCNETCTHTKSITFAKVRNSLSVEVVRFLV